MASCIKPCSTSKILETPGKSATLALQIPVLYGVLSRVLLVFHVYKLHLFGIPCLQLASLATLSSARQNRASKRETSLNPVYLSVYEVGPVASSQQSGRPSPALLSHLHPQLSSWRQGLYICFGLRRLQGQEIVPRPETCHAAGPQLAH